MTRSLDLARGWDIPKRHLSLTLYDGRAGGVKSKKTLSFVDDYAKVSFQTQASVNGLAPSANINITGLLRDTMGYLATSYTSWTEKKILNRIVLDAGYDDQHGIVFDGEIIEATPSLDSADFNISLKCQSLYSKLTGNISSISKEGEVDAKEIAQEIAKDMDVQLVYYPEKEYKVNYTMTDESPVSQMRNLSKMTGLDVYVENGRMYVKEPAKPVDKLPQLVIDSSNIIGAPMPDALGCRVQIRMNPNLKSGMKVKLNSKRFPILNSEDYFLNTYHHVGETKGKKWFSEVILVRTKIWQA
ncbi:MAG: hypothetical protein J6S67_21890 [Methanobrevibacter sp.]|nr:hypothetical protein [Methanobrevibacter sp.]